MDVIVSVIVAICGVIDFGVISVVVIGIISGKELLAIVDAVAEVVEASVYSLHQRQKREDPIWVCDELIFWFGAGCLIN